MTKYVDDGIFYGFSRYAKRDGGRGINLGTYCTYTYLHALHLKGGIKEDFIESC